MALGFSQKCKADLGGKAFRAYEITCDGSTLTIDASDLDLHMIENVWMASKNDLSSITDLHFAEIADGAGDTTQIAITGAALGDYVMIGCEADLQDQVLTAYVQSAGKVDVRLQNESGGAIDLTEIAFYIKILKRVGLTTQTGKHITFWPALADGDKFTIWAVGY